MSNKFYKMLFTIVRQFKSIRNRLSNLLNRWRRGRVLLKELGISCLRVPIIFDVGANDGSTFAELQKCLPRAQVYAFEPTPYLIEKIRNQFESNQNYHLIPYAVSETPGLAQFNIAGQSDWGCSSLLEFSDELERTWPGRTDFVVTQQIKVKCIRLDDFVYENKISRIDFLHVDTQGTDLSVLRSLGKKIRCVRAGVIEVPQSENVMLYRNQHTRQDALAFLSQNGFHVWKTVCQQNEENLYFRRTT